MNSKQFTQAAGFFGLSTTPAGTHIHWCDVMSDLLFGTSKQGDGILNDVLPEEYQGKHIVMNSYGDVDNAEYRTTYQEYPYIFLCRQDNGSAFARYDVCKPQLLSLQALQHALEHRDGVQGWPTADDQNAKTLECCIIAPWGHIGPEGVMRTTTVVMECGAAVAYRCTPVFVDLLAEVSALHELYAQQEPSSKVDALLGFVSKHADRPINAEEKIALSALSCPNIWRANGVTFATVESVLHMW